MEAKDKYNLLLSSGKLLKLYPWLSGDWEEDKKDFTEIYKKGDLLYNIDVSLNDEEDFDWSEEDSDDYSL